MTAPPLASNRSNNEDGMENYTRAFATSLNQIKNLIREVTKAVDTLPLKVYPDAVEVRSVKHELSVLLSELDVHGLLPVGVKKSTGVDTSSPYVSVRSITDETCT
jgi:hypothetical protein